MSNSYQKISWIKDIPCKKVTNDIPCLVAQFVSKYHQCKIFIPEAWI